MTTMRHASARAGSPLAALITLLVSLPVAAFVYLMVHGRGLETRLLPEELAEAVGSAVDQTRMKLIELLERTPLGRPCELGEICRMGQKRPLLADGRPSHMVWDLPRRLMKQEFRDVLKMIPNAKVSYIWKEPLVVYYDNVFSDEDIDLLIESVSPRFKKSMVVDKDGNPQEDVSRTSSTGWLYDHENPRYKTIMSRVAALSGFTHRHAEQIGVNRYEPGQYFNPHHDFLQEDQLGAGEFPGCQRASTNLIYLSDVEEGGETMFARKGGMDGSFQYDPNNPDHLKIKPKRGRLLVWYDMHPYTEMIDTRTLHGGSPVIKGVKMAATIFIRNCTRPERNAPTPAAQVSTDSKEGL